MTCKRALFVILSLFFIGAFLVTSVSASVPFYSLLWSKGSLGTGDGQYNNPRGIAIDGAGNIFVADTGNHRFQKLDSNGNYVSKFGTIGSTKSIGDLAIDASGNIYGALSGQHQIKKFSAAYSTLWTKGTTTAGSGDGYYSSPQGIATDGTYVYIADTNNHRVQVILASNGTFVRKFGSSGTDDGQFRYPYDVDVDSSGNIYVADKDNHRIQKFTSEGVFVSKFGVYGTGLGQFNQPTGIDLDGSNNVYVADYLNKRVQKFNSDGVYLAVFGGFTGNNYRVGVNSSNHVVTVDLAEQVYKFDFNGTAYQVNSLDSSLNAIDLSSNLNIGSAQLYGTTSGTVRLKNNAGYTISDVAVTLSADGDWSAVTGETDRTNGKSVIHNLTSAPGTAATHSLYVPIPIGKNSTTVRICPDATNLSEVSGSCTNGVSRTSGTYTESFGEITVSYVNNLGDNAAYWKIAGMAGSGGEAEGGSWTGSGTEGDPYQITTCMQLQQMNENLSAYYQISADIDCTSTTTWNGGNGFAPVGSASATPFTGSLTGTADFQIDGLFMKIIKNGTGLFGYTSGASLSNVHITNLHYLQDLYFFNDTGGLIGNMSGGSITNSSATGLIEQTYNPNYDDIQDIGGLVGLMVSDSTISTSNSAVNIELLDSPYQVGGLVGWMRDSASISDSFVTGHVYTSHSFSGVGGFVGMMVGNTSITNSYVTGDVHVGIASNDPGTSYDAGGFVGFIGSTTTYPGSQSITDSYVTGNVTAELISPSGFDTLNNIGGFAGAIDTNSTITGSHASGILTLNTGYELAGFQYAGGFAGNSRNNRSLSAPVISNNYFDGTINASLGDGGTYLGGFIGRISHGTISNSYSTANITVGPDDGTGNLYSYYVGGFVGQIATSGVITESYATGNIDTDGSVSDVGGFAGGVSGSAINISKSFSTGNVEGKDDIGGFVGLVLSSTGSVIADTYSRGNATSYSPDGYISVGGYGGYVRTIAISNSYSTGTPTALNSEGSDIGGFVGYDGGATATNSYWDTQTSGVVTSPEGTGLTTTEMKTQGSFSGWDFDTIWSIASLVNDGYPQLQFYSAPEPTPTPTPEPTPTPTSAPSEDSGSTNTGTVLGSTTEAPDTGCGRLAPPLAPFLFDAQRKGKKVTLSYTPVNDNTTGYTIMYGFFAGDNRFSVSFDQGPSTGALQYTVDGLDNNQEYAFWMRAYNECVPGPWSNYLLVSKTGSTTQLPQLTPTPAPEPITTITPTEIPEEEVSSTSEPITVDLTVTDQIGIPIENTEVIISEKPPKVKGPKKPPVASPAGELDYYTLTPTETVAPTPEETPTPTETVAPTAEPTATIEITATPTEEITPTDTPSPTATETPTPTDTEEETLNEEEATSEGEIQENEEASVSAGIEGEIVTTGVTDEDGKIEIEIDPGEYIMTAEVLGKTFSSEIEIEVGEKEQRAVLKLDVETLIEKDVAPVAIAVTKVGAIGTAVTSGVVAAGTTISTGVAVSQTLSPIYIETGRSISLLPFDVVKSLSLWMATATSGVVTTLTGFALKRKRYAGIVFDSLGTTPLPGAFVVFYSKSGALSTDFTDYFGQYTVKPAPGVYEIKVDREEYIFPSKVVTSKVYDRFENVYIAGEKIEVDSQGNEKLNISIPLDPSKRTKKGSGFSSWFQKLKIPVAILSLLVTGIAVYYDPSAFNKTIFTVVFLIFGLNLLSYGSKYLTRKAERE